jgi:hypothetical protein
MLRLVRAVCQKVYHGTPSVLFDRSPVCSSANAQTVNIVGLGSTKCERFNVDRNREPNFERVYFAWAQGLMSGILLRAPAGRDEKLNLVPRAFPVQAQIEYLGSFCSEHPTDDYSNGVIELYKQLRDFLRNRQRQNACEQVSAAVSGNAGSSFRLEETGGERG